MRNGERRVAKSLPNMGADVRRHQVPRWSVSVSQRLMYLLGRHQSTAKPSNDQLAIDPKSSTRHNECDVADGIVHTVKHVSCAILRSIATSRSLSWPGRMTLKEVEDACDLQIDKRRVGDRGNVDIGQTSLPA